MSNLRLPLAESAHRQMVSSLLERIMSMADVVEFISIVNSYAGGTSMEVKPNDL